MLANTVKTRAASSNGTPGDLLIGPAQMMYRPSGGNLQAGGPAAIRAFLLFENGEVHMQGNATPTVITTANTPVAIAGVFTPGLFSGGITVNANGEITNNTGITRRVKVTGSFTAYKIGGGGNRDCTFYFAINTNIQIKSAMKRALTGSEGAIPIQATFDLPHTQTLRMYGENNIDTQNIVVENINWSFETID